MVQVDRVRLRPPRRPFRLRQQEAPRLCLFQRRLVLLRLLTCKSGSSSCIRTLDYMATVRRTDVG